MASSQHFHARSVSTSQYFCITQGSDGKPKPHNDIPLPDGVYHIHSCVNSMVPKGQFLVQHGVIQKAQKVSSRASSLPTGTELYSRALEIPEFSIDLLAGNPCRRCGIIHPFDTVTPLSRETLQQSAVDAIMDQRNVLAEFQLLLMLPPAQQDYTPYGFRDREHFRAGYERLDALFAWVESLKA